MAQDAERPAPGSRLIVTRQNLAVLNRIDEPQAKHLQGNPEREIVLLQFRGEIRLGESAVGNRWIPGDTAHGPELMHAAVAGSVRFEFEPHLPDRPKLLFEAWHDVLLAEAMRNELEHWIFRPQRRALARIWNKEPARTTQCRLGVTQKALLGVVPGSKAVGIGVELWKGRIEFAHAHNQASVREIGACIAGRLQLPRSEDALGEGNLFVFVD